MLTLESYEVRHFRAAWWTPGGPEVNQDHLPTIVAQPDGSSIKVPELELRRFHFLAQNNYGRESDGGGKNDSQQIHKRIRLRCCDLDDGAVARWTTQLH